jgi:hypothetical protein
MPKVFEDSCELKVIEYGNSESFSDIVSDVKTGLLKLLSR